eukprot:1178693-Prorocentrum_minimum.AAC.1
MSPSAGSWSPHASLFTVTTDDRSTGGMYNTFTHTLPELGPRDGLVNYHSGERLPHQLNRCTASSVQVVHHLRDSFLCLNSQECKTLSTDRGYTLLWANARVFGVTMYCPSPSGEGEHYMVIKMAVFAHLGGENVGVQGARGGVEVRDGGTDQRNELICVPTIIAHMMGGERLGFEGSDGQSVPGSRAMTRAARGWEGVNWPYRA